MNPAGMSLCRHLLDCKRSQFTWMRQSMIASVYCMRAGTRSRTRLFGKASEVRDDSTMLIEIRKELSMKTLPVMTRLVLSVLIACTMAAMNAPSAVAQAGVPVPQDSPVYRSFALIKSPPAYRMNINMQSNDPRAAKYAAMGMGFSGIEKLVEG